MSVTCVNTLSSANVKLLIIQMKTQVVNNILIRLKFRIESKFKNCLVAATQKFRIKEFFIDQKQC